MHTSESRYADPIDLPQAAMGATQCALLLASIAILPLTGLLAGCGMAAGTARQSAQTPTPATVPLHGKVYGGQDPISGATIAMYAAGKTGVASTARSMLPSPVISQADGTFSLTGLYSCYSGDEVYLVATGGDAGAGINTAIALMTALGSCATLQANAATTSITVNEATTVASVYALQPFMTSAQNLGADYTSQASVNALIAAFANVRSMVDTSTAIVPQTSTGNGIVPQATIYSLSNSLASCINSSPTSSSACPNLFTYTTTSSSTPSDTLQATINIANNPTQHAADIFNLAGITPPFQPTLAGAPASYAINVAHPSDVLTYHNDNARDGVQSYEQTLNPANVNATQFGKLYTFPVDSYLFAQPLYVGGIGMPDEAVHNVVYAATTHGTVYAFDADGNNPAAGYLWSVSLVPSGERYATASDYGCSNPPEAGIVGTPVIDRAAQTMYVVVKTITSTSGVFYHRLHAISLLDGSERSGSPTIINPSFSGTGAGAGGGTVLFNGRTQNERSALLLAPNANGTNTVWISYASHCDIAPYHGIILGYDGTTLSNTASFIDTPNGDDGGIWMSNGGLAADSAGYIYASTGNGTFDVNLGGSDFGDAVLKLAPPSGPSPGAMTVTDYFVPYDQSQLSNYDLDVGGSEAILVTDPNSGPAPHLIIASNKSGVVYLINTDHMNHYDTGIGGRNNDIQDFTAGGLLIYNPAFFNNTLYIGVPLTAYSFTPGTLMLAGSFNTTPAAQPGVDYTAPVVSANGTSNGLVWTQDTTGTMRVFTPTLSTLYDSSFVPGNRDTPATFVKFTSPVVANGKVYLSGQGALVVYGLLP